ncbi:MAG: 3D domain-containing protein [Clostridia bacterium]|nr:3D domain-containing protein [Clostridia bacterium]
MDTKGSSCKYALIAILFVAIVLISCVGVELSFKDQEQPIVVAEGNIEVLPKYAAVQEKEAYEKESSFELEDTKDETKLVDENAKLGAKAFMQSIVDGSFIRNVISSNVIKEAKEELPDDVVIEVWALESGDNQSGEEVSENVQIEETTLPASTQEIVQGPPTNYVKQMKVNATAYCLCKKCCGKSPSSPGYGRTASGLVIVPGTGAKVIAVDPKVIPLGTKVYVDGYGYAVAADTGGAIKQNKIDVYMDSHSDALKWGRKNNINLYVLP